MRIDSISIYRVAMPLLCPWRTAYGESKVSETVLVKMRSADLTGWGEAAPLDSPIYGVEWTAGAYSLVRDWLAPRLLNQEIESGQALQGKLAEFKGNRFAKASLDLAWWDLHAKSIGKPLWKVLGGLEDHVEVGADFGVMDSVAVLLRAVQGAIEAGFKRVKLKFRPGWDLELVRTVRKTFPNLVFHVDCNGAYRLKDQKIFHYLDQFGLAMIEQPLAYDDVLEHAKLQRQISTPICLDESLVSSAKALNAIEIGAARYFNIKPGRVGGLTPALEIIRIAESAGIPCWVGGMLESGIGASHCLALATLPNIRYPSDVFPSRRFFERDLTCPEMELSGPSQMSPLEEAGIGCLPIEELLAARTVESVHLGKS
jgi:O-succinylbenzoate synthase